MTFFIIAALLAVGVVVAALLPFLWFSRKGKNEWSQRKASWARDCCRASKAWPIAKSRLPELC